MRIPALAVSNTPGFPRGITPQQISEVWDDHQGRKGGLGEVGTDEIQIKSTVCSVIAQQEQQPGALAGLP